MTDCGSRADWVDLFIVAGGVLHWKPRTENQFKSGKEFRRWSTRYAGKEAGGMIHPKRSKTAYRDVSVGKKRYFAHNIIWEMAFGPIDQGYLVDHIDGNGLNNSLENLRIVSATGNAKNKPRYESNSSGVSGVHCEGGSGTWISRVSVKGKRVVVYRGKSKSEAIYARRIAMLDAGYHENHGRPSNGNL